MKRGRHNPWSAPMLTHFTRASPTRSALDTLAAILEARVIRGAARMVRGRHKVVCLFDAPIGELGRFLVRRNRRRYEAFGIAVDKRYAFQMGARPVIYMPWHEAEAVLEPSNRWRVVSMDLNRAPAVDWTFEREWRLLGDLPLDPRRSVALVPTWQHAEEIFDRFEGDLPCAGVIPVGEIFGSS